jgi:hypothetical protein
VDLGVVWERKVEMCKRSVSGFDGRDENRDFGFKKRGNESERESERADDFSELSLFFFFSFLKKTKDPPHLSE